MFLHNHEMLLLFNCMFVFIFRDFVYSSSTLLKRVPIYSNDTLYNDIAP